MQKAYASERERLEGKGERKKNIREKELLMLLKRNPLMESLNPHSVFIGFEEINKTLKKL